MPSDPTRDVARAIGRLRDRLEESLQRNNPDGQLTVPESVDEEMSMDDSVTTAEQSGSDRYATYDQDNYGFAEYK